MLSKIKAVPQIAAAIAVAAVLTFGATQALADSPCSELPPHTCADKSPDPDTWCNGFCQDPGGYLGGSCLEGLDCCICFEK